MRKVRIFFSTFFKKGLRMEKNNYGNYAITGFQGSGKTYYAVKLAIDNQRAYDTIYTNIDLDTSLFAVPVIRFEKLSDIVDNTETHALFLIDEIANAYTKETKTDRLFYRFLQQSRKHRRTVYIITQEFKEIPMWLRRPLRYVVGTRSIGNWCVTTFGDVQNAVLDENKEWMCPPLYTHIYKREKRVMMAYDTFQTINSL